MKVEFTHKCLKRFDNDIIGTRYDLIRRHQSVLHLFLKGYVSTFVQHILMSELITVSILLSKVEKTQIASGATPFCGIHLPKGSASTQSQLASLGAPEP